MKYNKELYEQTKYFDEDEAIEKETQQVTKSRKFHMCCKCGKITNIGDDVLKQTALINGKSYKSCYICIECCDKQIAENKEEEEEDEKDNDEEGINANSNN